MKWSWVILTIIILAVLSGVFYWFAYRPYEIKKSCSFVNEVSKEIKEVTTQEVHESIRLNNLCNQFAERYAKTYYNCLQEKKKDYIKASTKDSELWKSCDEIEKVCRKELNKETSNKYDFLFSRLTQPKCEREDQAKNNRFYDYYNENGIYCNESYPVLKETEGKAEKELKRDATNEEYQKCLRNNGL